MMQWLQIDIDEQTRLAVPDGSSVRVDTYGSTIVVRLPTKSTTDLYICRIEFPHAGRSVNLKNELIEFAKCAFEADDETVSAAKPDSDAKIDVHDNFAQAVFRTSPDSWWIARAILSNRFVNQYWLLHWTGSQQDLMEIILPIVESFDENSGG